MSTTTTDAPARTATPAGAGGAPAPTMTPGQTAARTQDARRDGAPTLQPPDGAATGVAAQAGDGIAAWQTTTVGGLYTTNHTANAWAYLNGIGWRRLAPANANGHQNLLELCRLAKDANVAIQADEDGATIKTIYLW